MLPSKKSIRKMRTQPFPGWVLSFVKNADDYCGSLIMFSIKIIEHKKYCIFNQRQKNRILRKVFEENHFSKKSCIKA